MDQLRSMYSPNLARPHLDEVVLALPAQWAATMIHGNVDAEEF